jgi:tetratricopeptide (TPR) repeat protein
MFNSADANEWMEAADQHTPGEDDEHLRKIATWSGERLMRALGVVAQSQFTDRTNARLERAALLHADISIANRKAGRQPAGGWDLAGGRSVLVQDGQEAGAQALDPHLFFARLIFGTMRAPFLWDAKQDPAAERKRMADWETAQKHNPRMRQWYRAMAADLAAEHWLADLEPHLYQARRVLADNASTFFDTACLAELIASPQVQASVPESPKPSTTSAAPRWLELGVYALSELHNRKRAVEYYRKALAFDSTHAEARVRLAKVLLEDGRAGEAMRVMTPPIHSGDRAVQFYAALVLGSIHEEEGRLSEARTAYARAGAVFPRAQTPLIPMARLARELGDDAGAKDATTRLALLPRPAWRGEDPWFEYHDCNGRRREVEMAALYALFTDAAQPFRAAGEHR